MQSKKKKVYIFLTGWLPEQGPRSILNVRFVENIADEHKDILHVYAVSPGINKTNMVKDAISQGHIYDQSKIVPFSLSCKLCDFLVNKKEYFLSGRQIHVKDDYHKWTEDDVNNDTFKLRRIIDF